MLRSVVSFSSVVLLKLDKRPTRKPAHTKYISNPLFFRLRYTVTQKILNYRVVVDFIVSVKFPKNVLPKRFFRYSSSRILISTEVVPTDQIRKNCERPQIESMDILTLSLWYLKTRDPAYKLFSLYGIVSISTYGSVSTLRGLPQNIQSIQSQYSNFNIARRRKLCVPIGLEDGKCTYFRA